MKLIQRTIEKVITAAGYTDQYEKAVEQRRTFHLRATVEGYEPLVIEVLGNNEVSVAHYYTQNGDAMRDPEIVFNGDWNAVEITQDSLGVYRRTQPGYYMPKVNSFAVQWAANLIDQGFADASQAAYSSLTN